MAISPLRQRVIDDMTARHFGEKSQKDCIRCVKNLAVFLGRPPETADLEDLRRFRLHLIDSARSVSSVNTVILVEVFERGSLPATGRHALPAAGWIPHELQSAVEMGNAVFDCRPRRRTASPLSAECSSPAESLSKRPSGPGLSGHPC